MKTIDSVIVCFYQCKNKNIKKPFKRNIEKCLSLVNSDQNRVKRFDFFFFTTTIFEKSKNQIKKYKREKRKNNVSKPACIVGYEFLFCYLVKFCVLCINMLSYMVPVEDKSPPHNLKLDLNLDQSENANRNANNIAASSSLSPSAKILNFERQQHFNSALKSPPKPKTEAAQRPKTLVKPKQNLNLNMETTAGAVNSTENTGSILATGSVSGGSSDEGKKVVKMSKIGTQKNAALKR